MTTVFMFVLLLILWTAFIGATTMRPVGVLLYMVFISAPSRATLVITLQLNMTILIFILKKAFKKSKVLKEFMLT